MKLTNKSRNKRRGREGEGKKREKKEKRGRKNKGGKKEKGKENNLTEVEP